MATKRQLVRHCSGPLVKKKKCNLLSLFSASELKFYNFLHTKQHFNRPRNRLYKDSDTIKAHMLSTLMNWIAEYQIDTETYNERIFYLTRRYVDCFISFVERAITEKEWQLIGIVALSIAVKFEEDDTYIPVTEIEEACGKSYNIQQIRHMELELLKTVEYNLFIVIESDFIDIYMHIIRNEQPLIATEIQRIYYLCNYLLELALLQPWFTDLVPSVNAATAVLVAAELLGIHNIWSDSLKYYSRTSEENAEVIICSKKMKELYLRRNTKKNWITKKYEMEKYLCIAKL